jgi:hypothetical protein
VLTPMAGAAIKSYELESLGSEAWLPQD